MPKRSYNCSLNVSIEVDDETLKSAMLGFGLRDGLDGPIVGDPEAVFDFQEQMLNSVQHMTGRELLEAFLVNGYYVPLSQPIRDHLMEKLPGSVVSVTGLHVQPTAEG